ncbi:MAG: serine/threonine-protein kinase [Archangium sp.]|nr:serine/threonine-protein kinase [Archangium sp.]
MSPEDLPSDADVLLQTLKGEAQTLVRSPSSTVAPPQDGRVGRRALEILKGLVFDPKALTDEGPLGQGGMGVVRLAKQVALDRHVAVKFLRPEHRKQSDVEALLSEAWLAGALEHPNILPVYSVGLDAQGLPVIVMKRIEGRTWTTLLRDPAAMAAHAPGKAPLDEHLRILQQICNAVHFAHARGVVHRDLKPDNVMVGEFGEVYVVDWGIATRPGPCVQLAGTPAYMAPEMLGGAGATITERTDVYLLGSMLFEVLTGRAPHRGETPQQLVSHVLRSSPTLPAEVPEELADLVVRCMKPKLEDRPESALAVRRHLEAFVEHQGSLVLATQSERRADELRELLRQPTCDATRVYGLFAECRFGFQQALAAWSHNTHARAGLDGALEAMIHFELKQGSVQAARAMFAELANGDAGLSAALEAATRREQEKVNELERLQRIERQLDPRTGSTVRLIVSVVVGAIWAVSPMLGAVVLPRYGDFEMISTAPLALLSAVVIAVSAFRTKARTKLNGQLLAVVLFGMVVQATFVTSWYLANGDLGRYAVPVLSGFWFVVSGVITVSLLPPMWPTALAYLLSSLGALWWPELRFVFASTGNLALIINAIAVFRRQGPGP